MGRPIKKFRVFLVNEDLKVPGIVNNSFPDGGF